MIKLPKINKSHIYIVLLVILTLFIIRNGFGLYKIQYPGDATAFFFPRELIIKESFLKGAMPLWNPFIMSGTPLFAKPQSTVLSIYSIIGVLSPTPYLATTINAFIHLIILSFGIYLLSRTLGIEPKYAFISSLVCVLSAYVSFSLFFAFFQLMGLAFFPYVIMFTIKGLKSKKWIRYAIYAGIFISMEFLSGAPEIFIFSWWVVLYLLVFNLIGKSLNKRLLKSIAFGIIFSTVAICLVSIKLLPTTELVNISNRQQSFDFETSLGTHVNLKNAFFALIDDRNLPDFITHAVKGTSSFSIGIVPALLVLISILNIRKKRYLLFFGMMILSILMITNSPWNYLLWKYFPFFSKQKHVLKATFVFLVVASVLAAYGARYLISRIKDKRIAKVSYILLLVILVLTSWGFTYDIKLKDSRPELNGIEVMKYMAEDGSIFRFKAWETNGIDWGTNYYSVSYGLQDIYGLPGLWLPDYLPIFLSVANRDPAKFFGIMNMKYMTSKDEINIPGFELIKKFDNNLINCSYYSTDEIIDFNKMEQCPGYKKLEKAWGPYLYLNKKFLPRAYLVKNSILVVGEKEAKMQTIYWLMLNQRFNPEHTAIFTGRNSINDYDIDELKKYSAILLTKESIDEKSGIILKNYVDSGGILLPNVIKGETSITDNAIEEMWDSFKGVLDDIDDKNYIEHNFNKYEVLLEEEDKDMFLILSEKFSMFPGWVAKADGKTLAIERVDGVISAVYIDKPYQSVVFEYKPKQYILGKSITIIMIIVILGYFGYDFLKKKKVAH